MWLFGPPNVAKMKARKNIKGLIKALGYDDDSDIREAAAIALGELGDARAVEPLVESIASEFIVPVRETFAAALGEAGGARATEVLTTILMDDGDDDQVRRAAARALVGTDVPQENMAMLRAALFESVFTQSPEGAVDALFEQALPVAPNVSPETIQQLYEVIRESWWSRVLIQGSSEQLKPILLANLRRIRRESQPTFDGFSVDVLLSSQAVQVSASAGDYFIPVRVWRSCDSFFACGNSEFQHAPD